jgi:septal ring factor EnvC (AmiA/AmiB activator)
MSEAFDATDLKVKIEAAIAEDEALVTRGQEERLALNTQIKEAKERIATNERLLKALQGPKTRVKKVTTQAVEPDVIPVTEAEPFRPI